MKIGSVVRAAYQRTGGDVEKTFSARDVTVITELLRRNVFNDRQMFWSRAQILAHGQDLTAHLTQIVHRLKEFRLFFAQAEHHAALGDNTRSEFLRPAQNSQGRPILRARATIPGNHEGGCSMAPAFPAVRALRALANGV